MKDSKWPAATQLSLLTVVLLVLLIVGSPIWMGDDRAVAAPEFQSGGSYEFEWIALPGGGVTETMGNGYSLSSTIALPQAGGYSAGGDYALTGGVIDAPTSIDSPASPTIEFFLPLVRR